MFNPFCFPFFVDESEADSKKLKLSIDATSKKSTLIEVPLSPTKSRMEDLPYVSLTTHAGRKGVEPVLVKVRYSQYPLVMTNLFFHSPTCTPTADLRFLYLSILIYSGVKWIP